MDNLIQGIHRVGLFRFTFVKKQAHLRDFARRQDSFCVSLLLKTPFSNITNVRCCMDLYNEWL